MGCGSAAQKEIVSAPVAPAATSSSSSKEAWSPSSKGSSGPTSVMPQPEAVKQLQAQSHQSPRSSRSSKRTKSPESPKDAPRKSTSSSSFEKSSKAQVTSRFSLKQVVAEQVVADAPDKKGDRASSPTSSSSSSATKKSIDRDVTPFAHQPGSPTSPNVKNSTVGQKRASVKAAAALPGASQMPPSLLPMGASTSEPAPGATGGARRLSANWGKALALAKEEVDKTSSEKASEDAPDMPRLGRRRSDSNILANGGVMSKWNKAVEEMAARKAAGDDMDNPQAQTLGKRRSSISDMRSAGNMGGLAERSSAASTQNESGAVLGRRRSAGNLCVSGTQNMSITKASLSLNENDGALGKKQKLRQMLQETKDYK